MARTPADKFFSALNQAYDAMLEAIEKGNQRGFRASKTLLRQARRGEREVAALARKWSEGPTDLLKFYESLLDAQTRAQTRALELTREWLDEMGTAQGEVREALLRMIQANRAAGEAVIEATRSASGRLLARLLSPTAAGESASPAAPAAGGRTRAAGGRQRARRAPARRAAGGRAAPGAQAKRGGERQQS